MGCNGDIMVMIHGKLGDFTNIPWQFASKNKQPRIWRCSPTICILPATNNDLIYMQTLNSTKWGTYFHISRMIMGMRDVMWKGKHLQDTKYNLVWCVWSKNRLPGSWRPQTQEHHWTAKFCKYYTYFIRWRFPTKLFRMIYNGTSERKKYDLGVSVFYQIPISSQW